MKKLLLSFLFCLSCDEQISLIPIDGAPCVWTQDGRLLFGEEASKATCHLGKIEHRLGRDGNYYATCSGSSMPEPEKCGDEGRDADCFGGPDNIYIGPLEEQNPCFENQLGVCKLSSYECFQDTMICVPPSEVGPEICDYPGDPSAPLAFFDSWYFDNDCSGETDSEDSGMILSGPEFSYSGPPETLNVGECRAGHRECLNGREIIRGQILPTIELCEIPGSEPIDSDCDGDPNPVQEAPQPEALMFFFDTSGSMQLEIESSIDTICSAAAANVFPNSTISIHLVGLDRFNGQYLVEPYIQKLTDFVDFSTGCTELEDWYLQEGLSGGSEYVPEAIMQAHMYGFPSYVEWPPEARRRVIVFSDEPPDGWQEDGNATVLRIHETCQAFAFSLGVFTNPNYDFLWERYTVGCEGWTDHLSNDSDEMRGKIVDRLGAECVPK